MSTVAGVAAICGVLNQVDQKLFDLLSIGVDPGRLGDLEIELDSIFLKLALQEVLHFLQDTLGRYISESGL